MPIAVVLVLLGVLRWPVWQASLAGFLVALALAILVWRMPAGDGFQRVAAGARFVLRTVMWIVFNALLLYNERSGRSEAFRV